ncbi:CACTA en-spm transposon protein [Cucumis melo var. makuwa]|uniref:CACTA en-spm transposon protein n=1 Tax=Cucumis melo var. makuwa TaxID=1194695 RepID=A0A5D3DZS4_CUCMM|nr:CACTA en-spm transposon protein [Cucumis melo var. makuwa]
MTFRRMVAYQGGVRRSIRHVPYAWVIDRRSGYEVEYPLWDINAIIWRTMFGVEVGYTMERIPMSISPSAKMPILPHTVRFDQAIGVCVRKTVLVCFLRWVDVGREYIECFFMLDSNDQAMNRFIQHQMLTSLKEFKGNCHRHFKKYSDLEETHANPPHILVGCMEDWSNHGRTRLLDKSSLTTIVVGRSHFYNDNTSSMRNEASWSTSGVIQANTCSSWHVHSAGRGGCTCNLPKGSQPLFGDEICETILGRQRATKRVLVRDPSPSLARRSVLAVPRPRVCNPRRSSNYESSLMKLEE